MDGARTGRKGHIVPGIQRWHAQPMLRIGAAVTMASVLFASDLLAQPPDPSRAHAGDRSPKPLTCDENLPYDFVAGIYSLVGKKPARGPEGAAYVGALRLEVRPDCALKLVRCVGNVRVEGTARFELATADNIPVLRTTIEADGTTYEGRFKIDGDLDNYPILTGPYRVRGDDRLRWGWEFAYVDPGYRPKCE